jgi:hypothetical protein
MDVLISLSSSVAYFFSVGTLIEQILVGSSSTGSSSATSGMLDQSEVVSNVWISQRVSYGHPSFGYRITET